jgi:hypothetical protein
LTPTDREARRTWDAVTAARALAAMTADPNDSRHGTRTGYFYGCICDACLEANRAYAQREDVKARRKATFTRHLQAMRADPADRRHGTTTGYEYGCRCDACREACRVARNEYNRLQRQRANEEPNHQ